MGFSERSRRAVRRRDQDWRLLPMTKGSGEREAEAAVAGVWQKEWVNFPAFLPPRFGPGVGLTGADRVLGGCLVSRFQHHELAHLLQRCLDLGDLSILGFLHRCDLFGLSGKLFS